MKLFVLSLLALLASCSFWENPEGLQGVRPYFAPAEAARHETQGLHAFFLGNTNVLLDDGETAILTDGFFSRPGLDEMMLGELAPKPADIAYGLSLVDASRLAAVIAQHSHHDHAMDAPEVARQTGAQLVGSTSTAFIGRGQNLPEEQITIIEDGDTLQFGKFRVTFLRSKHTPMPERMSEDLGIGQEITEPLRTPAPLNAYKEGGTYVVYVEHPLGNVIVHGSSGYVEDLLTDKPADVIFLGIAGLGKQTPENQQAYFRETALAVGASRLISVHWDNFMRSIHKPLRPFPEFADQFSQSVAFLEQATQTHQQELIFLDMGQELLLYPAE
jgi:L-ascorbate metabolism protein UlaG (beta-lactamase superfamily)